MCRDERFDNLDRSERRGSGRFRTGCLFLWQLAQFDRSDDLFDLSGLLDHQL